LSKKINNRGGALDELDGSSIYTTRKKCKLKNEEVKNFSSSAADINVCADETAKKAAEKKAEKSDPEKKLQKSLQKNRRRKQKDYQGDRLPMEIAYQRIDQGRKADRKHKCGTVLDYRILDEDVCLKHANFCQLPLCPMCAEIRARKILTHLSRVITYMEQEQPYRFLHLTLTCANCPGHDLRDTLSLLLEAFYKMSHRMPFLNSILGYFRKIEITHKWSRKDDYHPHLHVLLAVSPAYFSHLDLLYLPYVWWQKAWQQALGVDYTPQVWIRAIDKFSKKKNAFDTSVITNISPILEIAKYVAKSNQYIAPSHLHCSQNRTNEAVKWFDEAITGRRLVGFGGEMKRVHKLLNQTDGEEPKEESIREDVVEIARLFKWDFSLRDYEETRRKGKGDKPKK
jgi:plasmid rolling circle replication initiator protein Rep